MLIYQKDLKDQMPIFHQIGNISEIWVQSLDQEDLLKKDMPTHSSILAWRIPCTVDPGRLQSIGLQRVRHDLGDLPHTHTLLLIIQLEISALENPFQYLAIILLIVIILASLMHCILSRVLNVFSDYSHIKCYPLVLDNWKNTKILLPVSTVTMQLPVRAITKPSIPMPTLKEQ